MSTTITNALTRPFAQRHAPTTFGELVFADPAVQQRLALYASYRLHGSIILHGPYGTAKSATALTIVRDRRSMNGDHGRYWHHYLGAALDRGLGPLLGSLNMMLLCENDPRPYIVIDEADQLPRRNQHELRHLLDTTPDLRVIMTTNVISAIDGGLQSRSECVPMLPPKHADWLPRAHDILADEGIALPNAALLQLLAATTDARSVLRELEALVAQSGAGTGTSATMVTQPVPPSSPGLSVMPGNAQVSGNGIAAANPAHLTVLPTQPPVAPSP